MLIDCIAIDFDDTFISDITVWSQVIRLLQVRKYKVICATSRTWSECEEHDLKQVFPEGVTVVFCGGEFKKPACEKAGYNVKIWIDDSPTSIEKSSGIIWIERLKSLIHSAKDAIKRYLTNQESEV
jgi:hypothetical protein